MLEGLHRSVCRRFESGPAATLVAQWVEQQDVSQTNFVAALSLAVRQSPFAVRGAANASGSTWFRRLGTSPPPSTETLGHPSSLRLAAFSNGEPATARGANPQRHNT